MAKWPMKKTIKVLLFTWIICAIGAFATFMYIIGYSPELLKNDIVVREELPREGYTEIIVDSYLGVTLHSTDEQPYAVAQYKYSGITLPPPNLNIEAEIIDQTLYIGVKGQRGKIDLIYSGEKQGVDVYLPPNMIERAEINGNGNVVIRDKGIEIAKLNIRSDYGNVELKGSYKELLVEKNSGNVVIDSDGSDKIVINNEYGNTVLSGTYSNVNVRQGSGNILLDGSCDDLAFSSEFGDVDIISDTPITIDGQSLSGQTTCKGKLDNITLTNEFGDILLESDISPKSIDVENQSGKINVVLPKGIEGFIATVPHQNRFTGSLTSDFDLLFKQDSNGQTQEVIYGDQTIKMKLINELGDIRIQGK